MKRSTSSGVNLGLTLGILLFTALALGGCGGGNQGAQNDEFFTSGSREADQRAAQRIVRDQQLSGSGEEKANGDEKTAERKQTLFERLGGEQGLTAIVDDFAIRAIEDPRVNWERKGVKRGGFFGRNDSPPWNATPQNIAVLKKHLVQFLSLATGGPPQYDGKDMKTAHAGMEITNAEFDAVIGDLKASLDKLQVANTEQKELLAIVESTRPQIVTQR